MKICDITQCHIVDILLLSVQNRASEKLSAPSRRFLADFRRRLSKVFTIDAKKGSIGNCIKGGPKVCYGDCRPLDPLMRGPRGGSRGRESKAISILRNDRL